MIRFNCPICNQSFTAEDSQVGQRFDCECGQSLEVPYTRPGSGGKEPVGSRETGTYESSCGARSRPYDPDLDEEGKSTRSRGGGRRTRRDRDYNDDYDDDEYYGKRRGLSDRKLSEANNKKIIAGLCGLLVPGFGVHKFVLGYTNAGIIEIVLTICTCGISSFIGMIEGIIYLCKSDEDFYYTYMVGRKEWF